MRRSFGHRLATRSLQALLLAGAWLGAASVSHAQQYPAVGGRQFPLNQMSPVGQNAAWATAAGYATPPYFQPVRLSLPSTGTVSFYDRSPTQEIPLDAPGQAGLLVGQVYRLKVSNLPEFPNQEFYPSIELMDRLHPPPGRVQEFPVTMELTVEELEWAAAGRLVTKVIYLEQPNRVPVLNLDAPERIQTLPPSRNIVAEADMLGRPVAILRVGGRTPDPHRFDPAFFGACPPVLVAPVPQPAPQAVGFPAAKKGDPAEGRVNLIRVTNHTTKAPLQ